MDKEFMDDWKEAAAELDGEEDAAEELKMIFALTVDKMHDNGDLPRIMKETGIYNINKAKPDEMFKLIKVCGRMTAFMSEGGLL